MLVSQRLRKQVNRHRILAVLLLRIEVERASHCIQRNY